MYYSQRTKGYEKIKLGNGQSNLYNYGCFVTSLANLGGKYDPIKVNDILKKEGFFNGDLIISSDKMAKAIGLEYLGRDNKVTRNPAYKTIAEVDMSPSPGKQQHFVVIKPDGSIIDPWTGTIRPKGIYPLVSYRLFKLPEEKKVEKTAPTPEKTEESARIPIKIVSTPPESIFDLSSDNTGIPEVQAVSGDLIDTSIPIQHQIERVQTKTPTFWEDLVSLVKLIFKLK